MKRVSQMFMLLIIVSLIGSGCIDNGASGSELDSYALKYNFATGEEFTYQISSITSVPNTMSTSAYADVEIVGIDDDGTSTQVVSVASLSEGGNKYTYNATLTDSGKLNILSTEDTVLPEIQAEIPNRIIYPDELVQDGDVWTVPIEETGNLTTSEALIDYELSGEREYKCNGFETVSIDADVFDCINIESSSNIVMNMTAETANGTIYKKVTITMVGEDWVDSDSGFLVKSEYDVDRFQITDLTEVYKEYGLDQAYREEPSKYTVSSELVSVKGQE